MAKRILIIDDDIVNLKMATHILANDYEVICAKSGVEGIDILRYSEIDLVLLDLYMPDMNGLKVLEKIREDAEISGVKVMILTASGMKTDVTEAIRLGALDFIKKPFFPTELLERIKKALQVEKKDSILVVDDDKMNLMLVQKILGIRYDVFCVSSGSEALIYLQNNAPNLILLDLHMPEMNGLETLEKIRNINKLSDVPVIFLTADSERSTEIEIFKAGAMDYIQKPFIAEVVIRRISRILELYHYQQSLQQEVDRKTTELRESNRKITNLTTQVMMALVSAIDAKDAYTNGHSLRVAEYSRELARRMGKSIQEMNDIYYIGLLHDIGKIGIPDRIINKPGRLTEEEYQLVKDHPIIGAEILENISEMPGISIGAHWHHEKYNGTGYPDGLAGEEIPEVARIIGVADAYDTMTSKRSYRDILPQTVVKNEILKGKGTQFDPVIAGYMLQMIEEDTEYQMHE